MKDVHEDEIDVLTIEERFQILRRRQIFVLFVVIPSIITLSVLKAFPNCIPVESAITIAVIGLTIIFSSAAFSIWNWRCPACRKWLGKAFSIRVCSHCRAILQKW